MKGVLHTLTTGEPTERFMWLIFYYAIIMTFIGCISIVISEG